jgi:hypothetical protein
MHKARRIQTMAAITNEPKRKGPIVTKVRGMFEHRAEWLYLILDEARKKGLKWNDFAPAAVYRCGTYHGGLLAGSADKAEGLIPLRKKTFGGIGTRVFEMKIKKSTPDELAVDFHYCPLVAAWKKQGATDEEIGTLCDIAMRGDAAIAAAFGAKLELGDVIAKGGHTCQLHFIKEASYAI